MGLQIDAFAYANRLSRLHPAYKAGCSLLALCACLVLDRPLASVIVLVLMLALTTVWAGVPWRAVAKLLFAEGSFLLAGVLGIALTVSPSPTPGSVSVGGMWVGVSAQSLAQAVAVFLRALGSVAALNFLALTTPVPDLLEWLRRLRVPEVLVELMGLIYRFTFVLLDSLGHMTLAHEVRLGFASQRATLRSAALIGANLFIQAFRRSQRLEVALRSRAWNGSLRVLPWQDAPRPQR
ncbi:MAG: cobalt ECF transporter T component CbiQ [Thermoflexales bacterium]|nr:cobalt ECF transporter T component CbiQ [Thermoflexales bacterium]